jgi:endopolyphosphatase
LINETFRWIEENVADSVDFVIWTGDSARHDNDVSIPRSEDQVMQQNQYVIDKFTETFHDLNDTNPIDSTRIPIIPTFGNNDILPHNIFLPGPNKWTKRYRQMWSPFIPEEQRHSFEYGGWFYVEAIPNKLAVFSLNTLYFFSSNSAVDGCRKKSEPGYYQMEWLRNQLQLMRERGMKVILTGHVPPARTESKLNWDETCWQKYNLWLHQFRDILVGSIYGHMNIDHFMFHDVKEVDITTVSEHNKDKDPISIKSVSSYLSELRSEFAKLPDPSKVSLQDDEDDNDDSNEIEDLAGKKKKNPSKGQIRKKFYKEIGGEWGERYTLSLVSASVVPNYFPSFRIIEYNTTGLGLPNEQHYDDIDASKSKKKKKKKKKKKPDPTVPQDPPESAPPGPAHSPQSLTWLGYTQYFANLTKINNEPAEILEDNDLDITKGKKPKTKKFNYEVEYNTLGKGDKYKLKDLTVKSYMKLAMRISGRTADKWPNNFDEEDLSDDEMLADEIGDSMNKNLDDNEDETDAETKKRFENDKNKKKKKKKKKTKVKNKVWKVFLRRAFVGAVDDNDLDDVFGSDFNGDEDEVFMQLRNANKMKEQNRVEL